MKIAISVYTNDNSTKVSPVFGKSDYFLIYDADNEKLIEKIKNHFSSSIGAEVFAAQLLIKRDVKVIVCGSCEDDAKKLFSEAGIGIIENIKVNPAIFLNEFYKQYRNDKKVVFN